MRGSVPLKIELLTVFTLVLSLISFGRQSQVTSVEVQRQKVREILQIQDRRTIHRDKLLAYLSDPDPVVRMRSAVAYANLQDTTVIPSLETLLWDPDPSVESAAAFAIGETAGLLGDAARASLAHDLVWVRIDKMISSPSDSGSPEDRCIEEIGKFGNQESLADLVHRFGNTYPILHQDALVMSIARFAIRGVKDPDATVLLLRLTKMGEDTPWRVMYALQRIGSADEIRDDLVYLVHLFRHPDPSFRMHLATLLGKLKDPSTSIEPLSKLADHDADWRVRVNALKALSGFHLNGHADLIDLYRRSFLDQDLNIAITALSSFGLSDIKPDSSEVSRRTFDLLIAMTENRSNGYRWQLQAEASLALARLLGHSAARLIHPATAQNALLREQLLIALGRCGSPPVASTLFDYVRGNDVRLTRAALEGLDELCRRNRANRPLCDSVYSALDRALSVEDVAVRTTAAALLRDSLYLRRESVPVLIDALRGSRVPDDIEAIQEIAATLGALKDVRAIDPLASVMQERDRSVIDASVAALKSITGKDYLTQEVLDFEPFYTDFDFDYLDSLPARIRIQVETIRGDIVIELVKEKAPFTIMNILKLASQKGYYRGTTFHRVVPNFVIQGGDPRGDGWGGPGYTIRSEFSEETFDSGAVGIASAGKDTEGSQFFITESPQPHLDGKYTLIGRVVSGMDVVRSILVDDHIQDLRILP